MPHPRPLLLPAPAEPFPGWINVSEVPGELGGLLLVLYRNVHVWAETTPPERGRLFAGGDDVCAQLDRLAPAEPLAGALRELCELRGAPERARPAAVSRACDTVSEWAEGEGHAGTAVAWARAAASTYPPNVAAAYRVGILARRRADYPTAEAWLQHAGAMGRRHGDWYAYALALNSLGTLHVQRGEFALARSHLARALRAAQRPRGRVQGGRKRLRVLEGSILHDLMTVAVYQDDFREAEKFAAEAFERMRTGHRRLPRLAHDVAGLWMERGHFGRALQVIEAVLPLFHNPQARVRVQTNLLRAAGAAGKESVFDRHSSQAWALLEAMGTEAPAASWTCLAHGAASLRRWDLAAQAAMQAMAAADARQETDQLAEIPALLDSIRRRRYADMKAESASELEERTARTLAAGLVESLHAMRAGE
ncbi:MAG TPA: tetratricopeptide repeat protein [Longimicrobiaceae bacterium]|nr:tetratricopeptide repeat protein [Longimicrobiaceae bacterium]